MFINIVFPFQIIFYLYIAEKVEEKEYQNIDEYQPEEDVKVNDAEIEESFDEIEDVDNNRLYCEKCGKEILSEASFCKYCGNKLN